VALAAAAAMMFLAAPMTASAADSAMGHCWVRTPARVRAESKKACAKDGGKFEKAK